MHMLKYGWPVIANEMTRYAIQTKNLQILFLYPLWNLLALNK